MLFRNKSSQRIMSVFTGLMYLFFLNSCNFYRVNEKEINPEKPSTIVGQKPSVINMIHVGSNMWQLSNLALSGSGFSATLIEADPNAVEFYKNAKSHNGNYTVSKEDLRYALQTHFFVDTLDVSSANITFTNEQITKLEILEKNKNASGAANATIITLAVVAGVIGGIILLIVIICGCPHVYVSTNGAYEYFNTLFTGANLPNLERDDFKVMPKIDPQSDVFDFLIKNEEMENQYTNLLELLVVSHSLDSKIIPDQDGNLFSVLDATQPSLAVNESGKNLLSDLSTCDKQGYLFNDQSATSTDYVYANFKVNGDKENAKLILDLKNTQWSAFVNHEFSKNLGKHFDKWQNKNIKKAEEEIFKTRKDAGVYLTVSVEHNKVWKEISTLELIGDVNYSSLVVTIPAELIEGDEVKIKLSAGFMFWDLDCISMDFSPQEEFTVERIHPNSVSSETGENQLEQVLQNDQNYMVQHPGDSPIKVAFSQLPKASENRTIILHSRGYYVSIEEFEGSPNMAKLKEIKANGFGAYSKDLFELISDRLTNLNEKN